MKQLLKGISALLIMTALVACSDETDDPPLPPAIPAANLDVVDIYDDVTDLSRTFHNDASFGDADTWYESAKSFYDFYLSDYPYEYAAELTQKAEAGDANAQFELAFWIASTGQFNINGDGIGTHVPDPCLSSYWFNKAVQQKHAPALTWVTSSFLGDGKLGHNNRRLASFHFWTWSQLRDFDIKNYTGGSTYPLLTAEEFQLWSEEFKSWNISDAISIEPKSCPGCTDNCVTVVEK